MNLNFWQRKPAYSVCERCSVHFEPAPEGTKWGTLCPTHRAPLIDAAKERERLFAWIQTHWDRVGKPLVEQMEKEADDASKARVNIGSAEYKADQQHRNMLAQ